jgi:hypothetical protein
VRYGTPHHDNRNTITHQRRQKDVRTRKRKTIWAYLDGKRLVDVVLAALDNNMHIGELKKLLIAENPGHEVTFKIK